MAQSCGLGALRFSPFPGRVDRHPCRAPLSAPSMALRSRNACDARPRNGTQDQKLATRRETSVRSAHHQILLIYPASAWPSIAGIVRLSGMDAAKALLGHGWPFKAGLTIPRSAGHPTKSGHAQAGLFSGSVFFGHAKKMNTSRPKVCTSCCALIANKQPARQRNYQRQGAKPQLGCIPSAN